MIAASDEPAPLESLPELEIYESGMERELNAKGMLMRSVDGKTYPDHMDPDWFDEIFPPIADDILHHAMRDAADVHTALALAGEVLKLARDRQERINCLSQGIETLKSLHAMEVEYLKGVAKELGIINQKHRVLLKANGLID